MKSTKLFALKRQKTDQTLDESSSFNENLVNMLLFPKDNLVSAFHVSSSKGSAASAPVGGV